MERKICDSIGSIELCDGCGAAKPHNPTYCEPCPVNKEARCKEAAVKNIAGMFLTARNFKTDSENLKIDTHTVYDLFRTNNGMFIIVKSLEQPFCLIRGHRFDKPPTFLPNHIIEKICSRCGFKDIEVMTTILKKNEM